MNVPEQHVVSNSDTTTSVHSDVHDRHSTDPYLVSSTHKVISHSFRRRRKKNQYDTTVQLSCLNATCDKTALLHTIVHHTTEAHLPPYAGL